MIHLYLSKEEEVLLRQHGAKAPIELMRLKAHAILIHEKVASIQDVVDVVGKSYRTVERWIKDFSNHRMASIFSGMEANENASKLTRQQKLEIKQTLSQSPSDHGLPKEFWDVPTLKEYVQAEFGVVYESVQSYHYLLKFSRLSFKYPEKFDLHRDEPAIKKRIREIRREIKPLLNDPHWEVFAADETGLMMEALTRRAWLRKGEKTIVTVDRSRQKQNYLGFLNLKTGQCHTYHIARGQQVFILSATKKHLAKFPRKNICIIWDNGRFHKGKLIQAALKKGQPLQRVHLISLPPYAPDTNPIEHVWREGKKAVSNHQFKDFGDTKITFENHINSRLFNYQI